MKYECASLVVKSVLKFETNFGGKIECMGNLVIALGHM